MIYCLKTTNDPEVRSVKTQIDLKIPLGFRLEEETRQMKIWDAETLLLTKKR